ncbi:MgtC/SapB transporter [Granulicella tundricola MP5ACTX9]|uniref:MgtC/SapB transporter n=2 Tax=Granulicella TaxID=940557 RepID=E8WYD6_GRATM|nr:MgtC/SapB transporter [Granulicella tundricola MP5ACTX9]
MIPSSFHFSQLDQLRLSSGTATRLLTSILLGGAIGLEREWRHKASGLRTNMLLCLGCAFFTLLSANLAGEGNPNKGQVASNIVQGVGFLGAGLILHTRSRVLGLTSAATVFVVASIGMACGAGLYIEAVMATVMVLVALQLIGVMEYRMPWKQSVLLYEVRGLHESVMYPAILDVMDKAGLRMNVVDRDSFGSLERVTFMVTATRHRHAVLLKDLRDSDATDHVTAYPDAEQD